MSQKRILPLVLFVLPVFLVGCSSDTNTTGQPTVEADVAKENFPAQELVGVSIEDFPDTGLVDQNGSSFDFSELPEKPILVSFIYTRCPMSDMCPLITRKMKQVQSRIDNNESASSHFVTITFDPGYDTPAVLRNYAQSRGIQFEHWDFVTGPEDTINTLIDRFLISAKRTDSGQVIHNLRTYVLDEHRTVRHWYRGSEWSVDTVTRDLTNP